MNKKYVPLTRNFFAKDTISVAKNLLGKILIVNNTRSLIVEDEAYIGIEDKASHASTRKKEACFVMWGPPGFVYIYLTYGMHYMFNISTEKEGIPAAVLIRALEPLDKIKGATNGPGRLTKSMNINKSYNNLDITTNNKICITDQNSLKNFDIVETTRVGVDYAGEYKNKPWRFYIKNNAYVSKK